jgi:hypothetical protein
LLAPWVLIVSDSMSDHRPVGAAARANGPTASRTASTAQASSRGPWGELDFTSIRIAPPADFAARFASLDTSAWYFRNYTPDTLARFLKTTGATDAQRDAICRSCSTDPQGPGLLARPDAQLVGSLAASTRTAIYRALVDDPRNPQAEPFRHPAGVDWFADSGLSPAAADAARSLFYRRGNMEAFADISALMPAIPNAGDRVQLFRTLAGQPALMLTLRVRPDSDLAALTRYWGRGGRERDVAPLLESLAKVPGGGSRVDVAQLLPPFARARLDTYPADPGPYLNGLYDCHWTSLNFWNDAPDVRLTDARFVSTRLRDDFHPIEAPTQLGDLVMLTRPDGNAIHSAIFVAAGVVFTKNGSNVAAPWVLMKLDELLAYYDAGTPVRVLTFRRNDR